MRRRTLIAMLTGALAGGCTMGLGDYQVLQCMDPPGTRAIQTVEGLRSDRDVTFSTAGSDVFASFIAPVAGGGSCIEAIDRGGYIGQDCLLFGSDLSQAPRQPMVTALGTGYVGAAVKTTAPCTTGALAVRFAVPGMPIDTDLSCGAAAASTGVALPAISSLDGTNVIVTWFGVPFPSRMDPVSSCPGANPAPLYYAIVPSSGAASFPSPVQLASDSTSVRPAAIVFDPPDGRFIVAPAGSSVAVWQLDQNLQPVGKTFVDALAGAKAVSAAATTFDGVHRLAIAAEIGCAPQTIAVAVGDPTNGYNTQTVSAGGTEFAVEPSVAWVGSRGEFQVSWVEGAAGATRVLMRRISVGGQPIHNPIDTMQPAVAASSAADGHIISFSASSATQTKFSDSSLGCDP